MILQIVYVANKQSTLEQLGNFFGEIASVLRYLIPISLAIVTMIVYFSVIPISILALIFLLINRRYNKRLPANILLIASLICWLWLAVATWLK